MRAIYLDKAFPDAYKALVAVSAQAKLAATSAGLSPTLIELVALRASQLNGCAFCLRKHTRIAIEQGESIDRIAVLQNWRDTGYFSEQEQAALALTEEITLIADVTAGRRAEEPRSPALTEQQIAAVRWLGISMNAFNRLSITSEHPVEPEEPRAVDAAASTAPSATAAAQPPAPSTAPAQSTAPTPGVVEELAAFMHADQRDE